MNRLIVWFLQRFPFPDRLSIYRAGLADLNPDQRREFLLTKEEFLRQVDEVAARYPDLPTGGE